jgi:hypothetical protein
VKYITDDQRWSILEVPFHVLKRDVPVELAWYIRNHVTYNTLGSHETQKRRISIQKIARFHIKP